MAAEEPKKKLNIFTWSEYIDLDVIADFEKTHNVDVHIDLYESNEEMIIRLESARPGSYDIIIPTTYLLPSLLSKKLIQPLDKSLLPNISNIDPRFLNISEDPGNVYTIPYQWGTSGLAIRTKDPSSIEPSWDLVYKPSEQASFTLFDTARDVFGSALLYLGYSANTTDPEELMKAGQLVIEAKNRPNFRGFSGGVDGLSKVIGNVNTIAQVYNGEAVKASLEDPDIHYVLPKEGCEIWLDLFAIPTGAANATVAHEFLNYIMEPQIAARLAIYSKYPSPNLIAIELLPASDRDNPGIYPPVEMLEKMEYYKDLGYEGERYEELWNIVKTR
jgi:spermidine/putrescine transport system substrate-binding protein